MRTFDHGWVLVACSFVPSVAAVESDQKGRGYELKKGEYVEVEKEELEAVQIESNHTIDIDSFVPSDEIDKRYLDHPYYIVPDGKAGVDAFAVIRDAMKDKGRVALARIVLTNREHIIALEPLDNGLMGTLLRYPYEVRSEKEYFDDIQDVKITKDMLDLAKHIVDLVADRQTETLGSSLDRAGRQFGAPPTTFVGA